MTPVRIAIACIAGAGMAGTFLPWASLGGLTISGTVGDGWLTLIGFLGAILVAVLGKRAEPMSRRARFGIIALAITTAGIALHDLSGVGAALAGSGLYLVCATSIALGLGASFGGHWWQPAVASLLLVLTVVAGFVHVVHGKSVGFKLCPKEGWSMVDTFVDADLYVGQGVVSAFDGRFDLMKALYHCGVFKGAPIPDDAPSCSYEGATGYCMHVSDCNGHIQPGLCEGPWNIQCCIVQVQSN